MCHIVFILTTQEMQVSIFLEYLKKSDVGIIVCGAKGNIVRMSMKPPGQQDAEKWINDIVAYFDNPQNKKSTLIVKYWDESEKCGVKSFKISTGEVINVYIF